MTDWNAGGPRSSHPRRENWKLKEKSGMGAICERKQEREFEA